jgi:hypothetical protein
VKQRVELFGIVGDSLDVGFERAGLRELQAALDPAQDSGLLVVRKIDAVGALQEPQRRGHAVGP